MRLAVMATAVGASAVAGGGETMGCGGAPGADRVMEVQWTPPPGPGASGVQLLGCADWSVRTSASEALAVRPGRDDCLVQGWRQDGQLRVESTPVRLDPGAEHVVIDFDLPESASGIGGIGARLHATGWGARIDGVLPGYPAGRAGLEPGDLIVEIGEHGAMRMSTSHVVRALTGTPDTEVRVGVERDGILRRYTLTRERIPD